jgi:hypothetical protein
MPAIMIPGLKALTTKAATLANRIFGSLKEAAMFVKGVMQNQSDPPKTG